MFWFTDFSFSDDWPEITHSPQSTEESESPPERVLRKSSRRPQPLPLPPKVNIPPFDEDFFPPPIKVHQSLDKGSRKRICETCGGVYTSAASYKRHFERMHLMIKKFSCDMCGYRAYKKKDVGSHLASHLKVI